MFSEKIFSPQSKDKYSNWKFCNFGMWFRSFAWQTSIIDRLVSLISEIEIQTRFVKTNVDIHLKLKASLASVA